MPNKNNTHDNTYKTAAFLQGKQRIQFTALQHALVPRSQKFTDKERQCSDDLINNLLDQQGKAPQKKLSAFFNVIDVFSIFCHGKTFRSLSSDKRKGVLNRFFNSPLALFRKGFWGLNTLARLGVYGQKELHDEIGYRVRPYPDSSSVKEIK